MAVDSPDREKSDDAPEVTRAHPVRRKRWWEKAIVATLILAILSGAYYGLYFTKRSDRLDDYYARRLSIAANIVAESIDGIWLHVCNAKGRKEKLKLIPNLQIRDLREENSDNVYEETRSAEERRTKCNRSVDLHTHVNRSEGSASLFFFSTLFEHESLMPARMDLDTLLSGHLPVADFDQVLLTRSDGEVLVSVGSEPLNILRFEPLQVAQSADDPATTSRSSPASVSAADRALITEREIAGRSYKVFSQPLNLPIKLRWQAPPAKPPYGPEDLGSANPEQVWIVVGLQKSDNFRSGAMAISPTVVIGAFGFALIGLFSLPYLKLRFLGYREALHAHDVLVLVTSLMVATTISTFAVLELYVRVGLTEKVDVRLNSLAADITRAFHEEIRAIDDQLPLLTTLRKAGNCESRENILNDSPESAGEAPSIWSSYPFLDMAYWVDENGWQVNKWTTRGINTESINLATRKYFIDASKVNCPHPPDEPEGEITCPGHFVESIRSRTTGSVNAVLSKRVKRWYESQDEDNPGAQESQSQLCPPLKFDQRVAAILSPLMSVIDPVVPPGFEFAIIDANGLVLFHDDSTRNLRENFFDELDDDMRVRAAAWSRSTKPLVLGATDVTDHDESDATTMAIEVSYRARPYRMNLSRLDGTPWALVAMYNVSSYRVARAEVLTFALGMSLLYTLFLLAVYGILSAAFIPKQRGPETFFHWLWPDTRKNDVYAATLTISAVAFVAWLLVIRMASASSAALMAALIATMAFAAIFGLYRHAALRRSTEPGRQRKAADSKFDASTVRGDSATEEIADNADSQSHAGQFKLYIGSLVAFVFVISILPPVAFFRAANNEIMDLFIMSDQLRWADDLEARSIAKASRFERLNLSDENKRLISEKLFPSDGELSRAWDIHAANWDIVETDGSCEPLRPDTCAPNQPIYPIVDLLGPRLPGIVRDSWELRHLARDKNRRWIKDQCGKIVFRQESRAPPFSQQSELPNSRCLVLTAETAGLAVPALSVSETKKWLVAIVAPLLLVGLLWMIIRNMLRLVFLMDLTKPRFLGAARWSDLDDCMNVLVLRHRLQGEPPESEYVVRIDASVMHDGLELPLAMRNELTAKSFTVIVDHFHIGLWDSKIAERKLNFLEKLLATGCRIVLHSDINPIHYFTMIAGDFHRGVTNKSPELGRWAAAMEKFSRCRAVSDKSRGEKALRDLLRNRCEEARKRRGPAASSNGQSDDKTQSAEKNTDRAIQHLAAECWPAEKLQEIALQLVEHPRLYELSVDEISEELIVNQVLDQAETYYRVLWLISGKDERMMLHHIAAHGFASWRGRELVRRLVHRGLVQFDPNPKIMNESFRRFVLTAELPEVLERWTAEEGSSPWARLRAPMIFGVIGIFVFLFATQPQLFNQSLAFTAAITAIVPTFVKLISLVAESRAPSGH